MGTRDPRVDAYIGKSAPFARPILDHLREVVHEACPEVEETMKWSAPHFTYKGLLCGMMAFKAHCSFGFWKGELVVDEKERKAEAMGQFGCITSVTDLPPRDVVVRYVKRAMELNEQGVKAPSRGGAARKPKPEIPVPPELSRALARNRKAREAFEGLSPGKRREYLEWIAGAKRDDTRAKRLATTVEWLEEGKTLNWKYTRS